MKPEIPYRNNKMLENQTKSIELKKGSERSFGLVFGTLFLVVALMYFNRNITVFIGTIAVSITFYLFTWLSPGKLRVLNSLWLKFGLVLGSILNPILLGIVFLLTVLPIGLFLRLISKDPLHKSIDRDALTYWEDVSDERSHKDSMFDQF